MTLESRIITVGDSICVLVKRLTDLGFVFELPGEVFPGPEKGTPAAIARIESGAGLLPLTLKLFWQHVGSVNLCGYHPEWDGCDYPDPLVVYPPSVAIQELDDFLADKEQRLRCKLPYRVPISPDYYHKEDVSGGMWYNLSVPAVADDPPLNDEWHQSTFVAHLELAVRWAGFPGLSQAPAHTWPVSELVRGALSSN